MKAEKTNKISLDTLFAKLRFVYIAFYLSFIAVMELIPVCNVMNVTSLPSLIFNLIAISGGVLLFLDFVFRGVIFKPKYISLMLLFFVTIVISIVVNMKYGIADNLKTLVWSAIQIFLVASVDYDLDKEMHKKHFKIIIDIIAAIWTLASLYSVGMFMLRYGAYVAIPGDSAAVRREGFMDGRLFGVFTDPNYAAIIAFTVILIYIGFIINSKNLTSKILRGIAAFINYIYIALSGSRTVEICVYIAVLIAAFWLMWCFMEKKGKNVILKILLSIVSGGVSLILSYLIFTASISALSYAPILFDPISQNIKVEENAPVIEESEIITEEETKEENTTHENIGADMTRPELENTTDITNNRLLIWSEYIRVFKVAWLTGTSPRTTIQYADEYFDNFFVVDWNYSTHNAYLSLFVCTGLFGGLIAFSYLVLVVVEILGYLIRQRKNFNKNYITVLLLTLVLMGYAVCGFSYQIIFFNNMFVTVFFWVLLGYTRAFIRFNEPERINKPTLPFRLTEKLRNKIFKKA